MSTTLKDCLYKTIHRNNKPLKVIAEEIGMSENYLTRAALPDSEESDTGTGCRFPLNKLISLIKATGDFGVLDWIERNLGRVGVVLPNHKHKTVKDICRLTMKAVKEFGEFVGEIEKSLSDQTLDQKEYERIQEEGYQAMQVISSLMSACKPNEKGKGK
jgi:hypothetical protein